MDACHPVWGVEMLYCCWLLVGQRFLVGVGGGRKRLNILGAYCPDDQEYLDIRLTRDNINGQQFVNLLRLLRASHPETTRFILYLDNARYYHAEVVKEWLARHPEFHLEPLPAYSPNLNLIERLWKLLAEEGVHALAQDVRGDGGGGVGGAGPPGGLPDGTDHADDREVSTPPQSKGRGRTAGGRMSCRTERFTFAIHRLSPRLRENPNSMPITTCEFSDYLRPAANLSGSSGR